MNPSVLALLLITENARAQIDAAETVLGPLEFGGSMYRFAVPVISLAFLMRIGEQFLAVRAGQKADWGRPLIRISAFVLLLAVYGQFASGIIGAVHIAGSIENAASEITQGDGESSTRGVLARRAEEFQKLRAHLADEMKEAGTTNSDHVIPTGEDIALVAESFMASAIDNILYAATWFTFTFAAFAIFALKTLSAVITTILLEVGPLMIAFAAIPGLTARYLSAWAMALIEVTAWGPVAAIILGLLVRVNAKSAGVAILEDASYAEHIVLNFVYAGMFLGVPAITHMIFSGSASAVGSTGMAAAVGGLAKAGRSSANTTRAAARAGVAAGGAAARVGGKAAKAIGQRLGDAATGASALDGAVQRNSSAMMHGQAAGARQDKRDYHAKHASIEKHRRGD